MKPDDLLFVAEPKDSPFYYPPPPLPFCTPPNNQSSDFRPISPPGVHCCCVKVKLRPSEADGWSGLGHCYWKKPDLFAARRCFLTSLEKVRMYVLYLSSSLWSYSCGRVFGSQDYLGRITPIWGVRGSVSCVCKGARSGVNSPGTDEFLNT